MALPQIPPRFDHPFVRGLVEEIERLGRDCFQRRRDLEAIGSTRIVLQSPDGTLFQLVVDNAGAVSGSAL